MTLFGRSDIAEITVPETRHRHERRKGQEGPFRLDCPECEPLVTVRVALGITDREKGLAAYGTTAETAPLTEAEEADLEDQRQMAIAATFEDRMAAMDFVQSRRGQRQLSPRMHRRPRPAVQVGHV